MWIKYQKNTKSIFEINAYYTILVPKVEYLWTNNWFELKQNLSKIKKEQIAIIKKYIYKPVLLIKYFKTNKLLKISSRFCLQTNKVLIKLDRI